MEFKLDYDVLNFEKDFGAVQNSLYEFGYISKFKADRACSVAAAANCLYYMSRRASYKQLCEGNIKTRGEMAKYMHELIKYIKPTVFGVFTLEMFASRVLKFATSVGVPMSSSILANSKYQDETYEFLKFYIERGNPVLMLNWNHKNPHLRNHWVTVVGIENRDEKIVIGTSNWGRYEEFDLKDFVYEEPLYKGLVAFM